MAKKKRKHFIKLNNKIKSLFNNQPFEDGITGVSDNTLYGLLMMLGEDIGSLERVDIIKYLRRVWSEGNYKIRKAIVDYLEEEQKERVKEIKDKVGLILSYLEGEDATPEEEEQILSDFMDKKVAKITPKKVKNKLFYLRKVKILQEYSKLLDIDFIEINSIGFIEPKSIILDGKEITINLYCQIELDVKTSELIKKDKEFIIEYLNSYKVKAKEQKLEEFNNFFHEINKISYLNERLLYKIFNSIKEPIKDLYHAPIAPKYIKKIVKELGNDIDIVTNKLNFLISKEFKYKKYDKELKYNIFISYEKRALYCSIWTNKAKDIIDNLEERNRNDIVHFELFFDELKSKLFERLYPLELDESEINNLIVSFLEPYIKANKTLVLKNKTLKKVLYQINDRYKDKKEKKKRELLLAKTIRDFKLLFPLARSLNRKIIFHVGPTNSGKTYKALEELKKAQSGVYLAPLRLLAQEGYEDIKQSGINVSLITGEEEIIDEDSTHISSTIEMLNSDIEVDVCVIDEIQMIGDRDRGWAWANALIGAPAKKVIITGSSDAIDVVKELANYLDEELEVIEFERKNDLEVLTKPTSLNNLEEATAIVTFSRKEVLAIKSKISSKFSTSVVYGNLSPEVRREEARRFREQESQILIATDAIAMGLNLPIKTILFARDNKFDGLQRRELTTSEVLQIAGRAGRYGLHESGYVGALDYPTLTTIKDKLKSRLKPISLPISVMASLEHVQLIAEILQTDNLYTILEFFASNMEFDGPFVAANIESMIEVAKIVDEYDLDLISKYHLACAPVTISSPHIEDAFKRYLTLLEQDKEVNFIVPNIKNSKAVSYDALLKAEDIVKEVSLYLWLSFKFSDKFKDIEIAKETRDRLNAYIEKSLKDAKFTKNCKNCGKELDFSYRFSICDSCYNRLKRGYKKDKKR